MSGLLKLLFTDTEPVLGGEILWDRKKQEEWLKNLRKVEPEVLALRRTLGRSAAARRRAAKGGPGQARATALAWCSGTRRGALGSEFRCKAKLLMASAPRRSSFVKGGVGRPRRLLGALLVRSKAWLQATFVVLNLG